MSVRAFRPAGLVAAAVSVTLTLASCADSTGVGGRSVPSEAQARSPWRTPASVEWNQVARDLVAQNKSNTFTAIRLYAFTSIAQREAVLAAERASTEGTHVSRRAAVAAASAVALSYAYPSATTQLEAMVRQQVDSRDWLERGQVDAAAGEALGRIAGAAAVENAKTDRFFDPWSGSVPTGPGIWFSSASPPAPPLGAMFGKARPHILESGDQFRPPPHPAFGSPEFLAALAEVREYSDKRTPEQDSIAKYWALPAGTFSPAGWWNQEASNLVHRFRLDERRTTALFALLNMVGMDAIIASHDAKYHYWLIRPSQADPAITLSIGLPNFPSYPSNHATLSGSMAEVLAAAFPNHAGRLRALANQAALSRVYGGIHYRFDGDAGLTLGRTIARYALLREREARESATTLP